MRLKSDKRQNNQPTPSGNAVQMELVFREEYRGEAPKDLVEGTASQVAKHTIESPARDEQLIEEVCERENCQQALARVKANKGSAGVDDGPAVAGVSETALAQDPGTAAEWNRSTTTGQTGGNP